MAVKRLHQCPGFVVRDDQQLLGIPYEKRARIG
jgi:hypothetical protein